MFQKVFLIVLISICVKYSFAAPGQASPEAEPADPICRENEQYSSCGSSCVETCKTWTPEGDSARPCTAECVPGCFCKTGLVRDTTIDRCVEPQQCKSLPRDEGFKNSEKQQIENDQYKNSKDTGNSAFSTFSSPFTVFTILGVLVLSMLFQ